MFLSSSDAGKRDVELGLASGTGTSNLSRALSHDLLKLLVVGLATLGALTWLWQSMGFFALSGPMERLGTTAVIGGHTYHLPVDDRGEAVRTGAKLSEHGADTSELAAFGLEPQLNPKAHKTGHAREHQKPPPASPVPEVVESGSVDVGAAPHSDDAGM